MKVFVDDIPIDAGRFRLDAVMKPETPLDEVLKFVQENVCPSGRVVMGVRCDGNRPSADALPETLRRPVREFQRLDVVTGTRGELIGEAMDRSISAMNAARQASRELADWLHAGRTLEAVQGLTECLQVWQQVHETALRCVAMLGIDLHEMTIDDEPLSAVIARPRDAMVQVKSALEVRDYVLLADVLHYELSEAADVWLTMLATLRQQAEHLDDTP